MVIFFSSWCKSRYLNLYLSDHGCWHLEKNALKCIKMYLQVLPHWDIFPCSRSYWCCRAAARKRRSGYKQMETIRHFRMLLQNKETWEKADAHPLTCVSKPLFLNKATNLMTSLRWSSLSTSYVTNTFPSHAREKIARVRSRPVHPWHVFISFWSLLSSMTYKVSEDILGLEGV